MKKPNSVVSIGSVSIDFLCGSIDTDPIDLAIDPIDPSIDLLTMWRARDGNNLVTHLTSLGLAGNTHTVEDLAFLVNRYLLDDYAPHRHSFADTGFHIGGFSSLGEPRLYHTFWNVPGSAAGEGTKGTYTLQQQHPIPEVRFLYNGRNDLVNTVLGALINEIRAGKPVKFPFDALGMLKFAQFVLRFGAELTPEVSPPFVFHLLTPNRKVVMRSAQGLNPLSDAELASMVGDAGAV